MTSPTIFRTAGLLAGDRLGNVPVDFDTMKAWGYSYVAVQGVAGDKLVAPDEFGPDDQLWKDGLRPFGSYQKVLRDKGLRSLPWQKLFGGDEAAVQAQAIAAAEFISKFRPDGFQINPETEYKEDGRWRSKVYVDTLLTALKAKGVDPTSLVWAIQPLGGAAIPPGAEVSPWAFGFDTAQWLRLPSCWCLPEAYWASGVEGASSDYRPLNCADQWINKQGWPAERLAFTLGWWNGNFASPDTYFKDLALVKQRFPKWGGGFGIFLVEQMSTDVVQQFGQGVSKGFAAAHEDAPPVDPIPDPAALNAEISRLAHTWLDRFTDPKAKARLRSIDRIARTSGNDPLWGSAQPGVTSSLDKAGA